MSAHLIAAREALVKALTEHEYDVHIGGTIRPACKCGWVADLEWSSTEAYDSHVADALLASDAIQTPAEFAAGLAEDEALLDAAYSNHGRLRINRDGTWLDVETLPAVLRALAAALADRDQPCPNGRPGACNSIRCGSNCAHDYDRMHPCPACAALAERPTS